MDPLERFDEYANAFEDAFKSDDWSVVEPFFIEDAVYEISGTPPFGGRHEGRDAILEYMQRSVDSFDRRFDEREIEIIDGPHLMDDAVWMQWRVTYTVADAPDLVLEGEERVEFEGGQIRLLEDTYPDGASEPVLAYFEEHADKLNPVGG